MFQTTIQLTIISSEGEQGSVVIKFTQFNVWLQSTQNTVWTAIFGCHFKVAQLSHSRRPLYFDYLYASKLFINNMNMVQNPSLITLIPLNAGWLIGIPLLDYHNPQYILGIIR